MHPIVCDFTHLLLSFYQLSIKIDVAAHDVIMCLELAESCNVC